MSSILFWLYGWHYLAHNLMTFWLAQVGCDTCQAWEDESIYRAQEAHKRPAPTKDCDIHPNGCQGYVYHTGRRSDVPKEERRN